MRKGDVVPDFELPDETGTPRRLSELLATVRWCSSSTPAAMTYGCTKESCHFRDLEAEFEAVGAQRVGISADTVEKQKQFSDKHHFDYPLLSDPDWHGGQQLGVKRSDPSSRCKRTTFVIDTDRTILAVIHSRDLDERPRRPGARRAPGPAQRGLSSLSGGGGGRRSGPATPSRRRRR